MGGKQGGLSDPQTHSDSQAEIYRKKHVTNHI